MSDQHILASEEGKKLIEGYLNSQKGLVSTSIELCKLSKDYLALIRETPGVLEIFSAEEIIDINNQERAIPVLMVDLHALSQSCTVENFQAFLLGGELKMKLDSIVTKIEEIRDFIEKKKNKVPEPKIDLISWLLAPYSVTAYFIKGFFFKVKMRRSLKDRERLEEQRKKLERQREELKMKKERLIAKK